MRSKNLGNINIYFEYYFNIKHLATHFYFTLRYKTHSKTTDFRLMSKNLPFACCAVLFR